MASYRILTGISEAGPRVLKLILEFPFPVHASEVSTASFNVYAERREAGTADVVRSVNPFTGEGSVSKGYLALRAAYICDESGNSVAREGASRLVCVEPEESPLNRRVEGGVLGGRFVENFHRITLLHAIAGDPERAGLVWDACDKELVPQLAGWKSVVRSGEYDAEALFNNGYTPWEIATGPDGKRIADVSEATDLEYAYYDPKPTERVPVVVWLHGAGEGGSDIRVPETANALCNLSTPDFQKYFGGKAYVLVPQCPTVFMDDGKEQLGRSNRSVYVRPLKRLIDGFIQARGDTVDPDRIYIGGMSNGGFMTMRMIFDYPRFFAAALPCCEAFYSENITDEMLDSIRHIPVWFVHSRWDELVPPFETAVPTYKRLLDAGAENVHFTFYDQLFRNPGVVRDLFGRKVKGFNHAVWNYVLENDCRTDFDGRYVMADGAPVTIWEWVGRQKRTA